MSEPAKASDQFSESTSALREQLTQFNRNVQDIRQAPPSAYQQLKTDLMDSFKNGQKSIQRYRESLNKMPKDLRRRSLIKNLLGDVETFEKNMMTSLNEFNEGSLKDYKEKIDQGWQKAQEHFKKIQDHVDDMMTKLDDVEDQTVIQKFVMGEPVLGCRKAIQWERKIFHVLMGTSVALLYNSSGFSQGTLTTLAVLMLLVCTATEVTRHLNPEFNKKIFKLFGPIMREREKDKINSGMFYVFSIVMVYLIFPFPVAVLTLLFLAWGDPIAGVVGIRFGKTKIDEHSSLEGTAACVLACFALAWVYVGTVYPSELSTPKLFVFSSLAAFTAGVAETSFKKFDDNLVMPALCAPVLWILMTVFQVF